MTGAGGNPVCTHCGFTFAEHLARGLLGCPSCYEQLGEALRAELLQLHPLLHRAPFAAAREATDADVADVATLREKMGDALRLERYEEAAALRKRLDALGDRNPGKGAGA
jgi:protein arginine kinase activator